jgi:succinate dehydrogenase flavin-adding protein (antitoxin of CptAB toxin-antitoxin module)
MINTQRDLLNKILYRAKYRGSKELDILFADFIAQYLHDFTSEDIDDLFSITQWDEYDLNNIFIFGNINSYNLSLSIKHKITEFLEILHHQRKVCFD